MVIRVNAIDSGVYNYNFNNKKQTKKEMTSPLNRINSTSLSGIPRSYITFKGAEELRAKLDKTGKALYDSAEVYAKENGNKEITPQHIIQAAILETELGFESMPKDLFDLGVIESVSTLNKLANYYAKRNLLIEEGDREIFKDTNQLLKNDNLEALSLLSKVENKEDLPEKLPMSKALENELAKIEAPAFDAYMLLASSINALSYAQVEYPNNYLTALYTLSFYKSNKEISENYMKAYDHRAIEVWNKLALGSNLFVTHTDDKESERMVTSIVNTLGQSPYGDFTEDNTMIYVVSENPTPQELLKDIVTSATEMPDKKMVYLIDMGDLLSKSVKVNEKKEAEVSPEFLGLTQINEPNVKLIFMQEGESLFKFLQDPTLKSSFSDFLTYKIPPIHTYEALEIIENDKEMLKSIGKPFSKEAREKAVLLADKMDGVFPDKAIDLMKRIGNYYGPNNKKISTKEVDEFAYLATDLFNKDDASTKIIYDTGKTLANYYGKETTKKDIEAIIRQIKTGRIGTKGMIIYSKDKEAGSGRKFTAEVIAGEAKVPFLEISSSEFAVTEVDEETKTRITPAEALAKTFSDLKEAAKQNPNKTAIMYINEFEEFAFSGPYLAGYKQAMAQLVREMAKAEKEDVNILVIGSTEEQYVPYIPMVIRGFSQNIAVDSPATNKQARRDVLINRIAEKNLPLAYRTKADKEVLINKLVKLTEYASFVEIKSLIDKAEQIMGERGKKKAGIGEFIEAYLQLATGRTSRPEMPDFNKDLVTSHECGHATNLEVMRNLYETKGQPWFQSREVNFITLDPRGDFLGAVFEGRVDNFNYPFEAMFADLVCSFGGHSCEKTFFNQDGSVGISGDLAQASAAAKHGIERYGFGFNTGKISNAVGIKSTLYNENVFKDMDVILTNAQVVSDLITETYKKFNEWFTEKYSKLIGTDDCMVDGDDFRNLLASWKKSQPKNVKEDIAIMEDIILDVIKSTKKGKKYGTVKKIL